MRLPPVNNRQVAEQAQEPGIVARRRVSAGDDRLARKQIFAEICQQSNAELVQVVGKIAVLYKKIPA